MANVRDLVVSRKVDTFYFISAKEKGKKNRANVFLFSWDFFPPFFFLFFFPSFPLSFSLLYFFLGGWNLHQFLKVINLHHYSHYPSLSCMNFYLSYRKQSAYLLWHPSALPTLINSPCSLFNGWPSGWRSNAQTYAVLPVAAKLCSCAFLWWSILPQHLCLPHIYHPADLRYHIH